MAVVCTVNKTYLCGALLHVALAAVSVPIKPWVENCVNIMGEILGSCNVDTRMLTHSTIRRHHESELPCCCRSSPSNIAGATRNLFMTGFGHDRHPEAFRGMFPDCVSFVMKNTYAFIETATVEQAVQIRTKLLGTNIGGNGPVIIKFSADKVRA